MQMLLLVLGLGDRGERVIEVHLAGWRGNAGSRSGSLGLEGAWSLFQLLGFGREDWLRGERGCASSRVRMGWGIHTEEMI